MSGGFEELLDLAADPAWRDQVQAITQKGEVPGVTYLDPALYLACFSTPAGRLVLRDLYDRYVNVAKFVPGMTADQGFYNEGQAQVVFDIVGKIESAAQGEETPADATED